MTLVTLRPSGTDTNTTSVVGAASAHVALNDNSDSSYITSVAAQFARLNLDDLTLPAGAVIKSIALRARTAKPGGGLPRSYSLLLANYSTGNLLFAGTQGVSWTVPTTTTFATQSVAGITDADVDGAQLQLENLAGSPDFIRALEAYVDVVYAAQPTDAVSAPTGTVTTTNLPQAAWTLTLDADGGAQTQFQVKLFTAAQYGIGGFDPGSSPDTLDSGVLDGAGTSWTPTTPLADATYRAYVRSAQTVNGVQHWSDWAFSGFTISVPLPAVPTLSAAADGNARIALALDDAAGPASTDAFEIQRSLDGGLTWQTVRQLLAGYLPAANVLSANAEGLETSAADWANTTNVVVAQSNTVALDGTFSLRMSSVAAGSMASRTASLWPVTPGLSYTFRASFRAGATARSCRVDIQWLDAGGSALSTISGAAVADATGAWTAVSVAGVAPVGATQARPILNVLSTAAAAELHYADRISLKPRVTLYDYEANNGVAASYRARAVHNYSGLYAASAWTATQTAAWTGTAWWLKHPNRPALNSPVRIRSFQTVAQAGRNGVFQPLGSSSVVVVSDTRGPRTGTIVFRLDSLAEHAKLDALLDTTDTLLLQGPLEHGSPGYVRFGNHERQRMVDRGQWAGRTFDSLEFTAVESPPGNVVAWP